MKKYITPCNYDISLEDIKASLKPEPSQLRHALETKVSIFIIDAEVSNEDAELVADLIRGCYC